MAAKSDLPRYEKLPLFNPHRKTFTCVYQDQHVPPIDPQAELWFQQALALDDPDIYYKKRDYPKIYQLYTQAAERNHWKAMLNMAALILDSGTYRNMPVKDPEVAIQWVEKAMKLGVPDAYDTMGTYHENGIVHGGGSTMAYAFYQKAADMGSPLAMTYLGDKLGGTYDAPPEFWGNRPIAVQMLQCAVAQGYGDAAYELAYYQKDGYTAEGKALALKTLHEGVKLGSYKCAKDLASEFRGFGLSDGENLVGHIDSARADRYFELGRMLEFYSGRIKLPNLDKVLPLPPAPLPKWDGDEKKLIDAAKAVTPPPKPNPKAALQGREQMPQDHDVLPLAQSPYAVTGDKVVPETGYWLALYGLSTMTREQLLPARRGYPERYEAGERFELGKPGLLAPEQVQWFFLGEAKPVPPAPDVYLKQLTDAGFLRQIEQPPQARTCHGLEHCPRTGIWEGRVKRDHPMAAVFNRWDQQAFVQEGQPFPEPELRHLDIPLEQVQWTYLGSANGKTPDGFDQIAL
nr:tetratricopeptide repeat protein [Ralstonia sp. UBA689]